MLKPGRWNASAAVSTPLFSTCRTMSDPEHKLDPDLDALANDLRKMFVAAKSDQLGKSYKMHDRFRNIALWYAVAQKCKDLNADPQDFIEAAFNYCSVAGGPFPQNLATRAMDRWYKALTKVVGANLPAGMTIADYRLAERVRTSLMTAMSIANANKLRLRDILLDEHMLKLDLCPAYVRVLLLPKDQGVVDKWGAKARSEIMSNPRLLKTLNGSTFDLAWL